MLRRYDNGKIHSTRFYANRCLRSAGAFPERSPTRRTRADGSANARKEPAAKSIIPLNLGGGFSAQNSWDPKPEAPAEYRGPFNVTKTKNGELVSEHFPRMAAVADKFTVIRSCNCRIPDHGQATYHLFTGYLPTTI